VRIPTVSATLDAVLESVSATRETTDFFLLGALGFDCTRDLVVDRDFAFDARLDRVFEVDDLRDLPSD